MIQFNLLPDIKLEYIRTKRNKRTVMLVAVGVAGAALGIFILLFITVNVVQKQHLNNLTKDINADTKRLQEIEGLDKILTVQNQLNKLTELHDNKPVTSRFQTYLTQITPANVSYSNIKLDLVANSLQFTGSADSIKTINQFVDTLKFTKYKAGESSEEVNAFSNVVLTSFGKAEKGASYDISLVFDPLIFASQSQVQLLVPTIITTRSATEKPTENILLPQNSQLDGGGL